MCSQLYIFTCFWWLRNLDCMWSITTKPTMSIHLQILLVYKCHCMHITCSLFVDYVSTVVLLYCISFHNILSNRFSVQSISWTSHGNNRNCSRNASQKHCWDEWRVLTSCRNMMLQVVHVVCCLRLPGTLEVQLVRKGGGDGIVKQLSFIELHCSSFGKRPVEVR